ncbi:MAG: M3 family oligoendopeptidase, partial [Acidimicrobiia bacterium]
MTPTPVHFDDVSAPRPDLDALTGLVGALEAGLTEARSMEECLATVRAWDGLRREVGTYNALVELRFNQDTTDPARKAAREAWDEVQ